MTMHPTARLLAAAQTVVAAAREIWGPSDPSHWPAPIQELKAAADEHPPVTTEAPVTTPAPTDPPAATTTGDGGPTP